MRIGKQKMTHLRDLPGLGLLVLTVGCPFAAQSRVLADGRTAKSPGSIQLTLVDGQAIGFATFQSHNQKVVSNRHGLFITYVRRANADYRAQLWRLARSTDGGKSFTTVLEETRATSAPALEPNSGRVFLFRIKAHAAAGVSQREYRIETIAGNGQHGDTPQHEPGTDVPVDLPFGVELGPDGAHYITTAGSHRVLRLDDSGKITTVAGNGRRGYAGDGGRATLAMLNEPHEVRFDSQGNMLILEMSTLR